MLHYCSLTFNSNNVLKFNKQYASNNIIKEKTGQKKTITTTKQQLEMNNKSDLNHFEQLFRNQTKKKQCKENIEIFLYHSAFI